MGQVAHAFLAIVAASNRWGPRAVLVTAAGVPLALIVPKTGGCRSGFCPRHHPEFRSL